MCVLWHSLALENKFESVVESIKNAPKSGRPKVVSRKESVSKIKEIIEVIARITVRDIVRKVLCVQEFSEQRFFAFISLCADWSHNDHQNLMHLYTA